MIRYQHSHSGCVLAIAFAVFMGAAGTAQDSSLERRIVAIAELEARNRTALTDYAWKQEETILVNDKFLGKQMFQAEMDPDGKIQRTSLDLPEAKLPDEQTNRGMREWLDKKKERTLQKYAEQIRELAETYTQASPDLLRSAFQRGDVSYASTPTAGSARLMIRNYVKSGDSVALAFDPKTNDLQSLEAASYLDTSREPVQIVASFAGAGDEINRADEITAVDKKRRLQVSIHNLDYQQRSSR